MQLYYFSNPIRSFLNIFILIGLTGCGSYQNSSVMTEDIYETDKVVATQVIEVQQLPNSQNIFYKNAFSEKSKEYELVKAENDILFTEAEQYTDANTDNDSTDVSYGPWGDNKTNVTINMLGGRSMYSIRGSRSNYPSWMMNSGYGYGNVFGYGLNSWGYGYDMYWAKPYWNNFHNGLFYPYWNNMGYGYGGYGYGGYGYGYGFGYGYGQSNNFYRNTNVAYVSGRRGSTALAGRSSSFSSRVSKNNYASQSRISDNMINSNLRDRTSRVEKLNQTLATKPNYNSNTPSANRPSNAKPSKWKPANSNNNTKPSYNNSKPSKDSKPSYNSRPSYNSKPSYNSRPSMNSSSPSRGGNSSSSSSSRGGKIGGN